MDFQKSPGDLIVWMTHTLMDIFPPMVWHILLVAGLVGYFITFVMKFIPFMGPYRIVIRIVSFIVLLFSVYVQGAMPCHEGGKKAQEVYEDASKKGEEITDKVNNDVKNEENKIDNKAAELQGQIDSMFGKNKELAKKAEEERRKAAEAAANFNKMSAAEKDAFNKRLSEQEAKYQKDLEELRKAQESCPIPNLVVDQINKAVRGEK